MLFGSRNCLAAERLICFGQQRESYAFWQYGLFGSREPYVFWQQIDPCCLATDRTICCLAAERTICCLAADRTFFLFCSRENHMLSGSRELYDCLAADRTICRLAAERTICFFASRENHNLCCLAAESHVLVWQQIEQLLVWQNSKLHSCLAAENHGFFWQHRTRHYLDSREQRKPKPYACLAAENCTCLAEETHVLL